MSPDFSAISGHSSGRECRARVRFLTQCRQKSLGKDVNFGEMQMMIKHAAASLAILVLVSGCAADTSKTDSELSQLRTDVQEAKSAAMAAQKAAEAAQKSASQSAAAAAQASKDSAQASARAEALYNRSLRKGR